MSYEFNPDTQSLELPNPYKLENISLFISGFVACGCGLLSLVGAANAIAREASLSAMLVTAIAVALLSLGIWLVARVMAQLRFFFGRHRPQSLAPELESESQGDSPQAVHYKDTLRHNVLVFEEPRGSLNGLLYSWLPTLIFAPTLIQRVAQRQFRNLLGLSTILASFLMCWALMVGSPASGWVGLVYAGLAMYCIRPLRESTAVTLPRKIAAGQSEEFGNATLVAMLVFSILGPVLANRVAQGLPNLGEFSANGVVLIAMLLAMGAMGTFFMAVRNQLSEAPQEVGVARVVDTVTMNAHPAKLVEELDRTLMNDWFHRIPNRRYTHLAPQVQGIQGQFRSELLEETQPQPKPNTTAKDWGHALGEPYFCWLVYLTGLATASLSIGVISHPPIGQSTRIELDCRHAASGGL